MVFNSFRNETSQDQSSCAVCVRLSSTGPFVKQESLVPHISLQVLPSESTLFRYTLSIPITQKAPSTELELFVVMASVNPNASPAGSVDTNTTPDTDISPPQSPVQKNGPSKDPRASAKTKLATLTLEEKVGFFGCP